MGLLRPEDRQLYLKWVAAAQGRTDAEVAALMGDITQQGVNKLRAQEPSRLMARTRRQMEAFLANARQRVTAVRESTGQAYDVAGSVLSNATRVWIQKFLLRLTESGVGEEEVEEARRLLTKSDVVTYAHGGAPGAGQLSEEQKLQVVKLIAESVIIPRLKSLGRKVNVSLAR